MSGGLDAPAHAAATSSDADARTPEAPQNPSQPEVRKRVWPRLVVIAAVAAGIAAIAFSGAASHLNLVELKARSGELTALVHRYPLRSVLIYVAVYWAVVTFSIPGALIMTLAGGFLFGPILGGVAAVSGVSSGAIVMFLLARTAFGDVLQRWSRSSRLLRKVENGVRGDAFTTILTLRLLPAAPIWLVNIAAGLVRMRVAPYCLATVLGVIPSTFIYAWVGHGLKRVFAMPGAPRLETILTPGVLAPVCLLAVLAFAPLVARRRSGRRLASGPGAA